ncbi:MAG: hypothetical protein JXR76_11315 [Deltaproteobacteria bacterium]|nr:hypothetical protein [Deltaproteobacteria bacterium]
MKNGIVVHYIYENFCGMPHFQFFSEYISETGYRSDFFGNYGHELSSEEVLDAFDVRANLLHEKHQEELRKDPAFRKNCASQSGQLQIELDI